MISKMINPICQLFKNVLVNFTLFCGKNKTFKTFYKFSTTLSTKYKILTYENVNLMLSDKFYSLIKNIVFYPFHIMFNNSYLGQFEKFSTHRFKFAFLREIITHKQISQ